MGYSNTTTRKSFCSFTQQTIRNFFISIVLGGIPLILFDTASVHAQPCSSTPVAAGYRDFSFGSTIIRTPTAEKPESKLWWNDGYWWGSLWSTAANSYRIHRFNVASQCWENVGPDIDNRTQSLSDALSDGDKLYIASHIFSNTGSSTTAANAGRLYRYSYDSGSQTYSLDSGFPVTINLAKSETLVLAKDTAGKLWITWTQGGKVKINRSTTNDLTWGTAFDLPVQGGNTKGDDISSIIAFTGNKIGVMWSNQTDLKTYFAVHIDGNSDTQWEPREEALADASLGPVADDHINLKMTSDDGGNLYAVTKTSLTNLNHPLIYLLKRTSSGVWSRHVVGKKIDDHTRPILLIDDENRRVYVFAKSDRSTNGTIRMKSASLDDLVFPDGVGDMFIRSNTDVDINNPTSTKQNVNGTTDLLVLASDEGTRNYMHNFLDLPGGGGGTQFTLTTNVTPAGSGTISPSGGTYNSGTQVQLTATPSAGWVFDHWSGDLSGSTNPETITMNSNKSVTANFVQQSGQFTLTTNTVGSGTVSLDPPGGTYNSGQVVTVTANASAGWTFSGWSGDLSGSANPETVAMNSNKNVTATFTQVGGGGQIAHEETKTGGSTSSTTVSTSSSLTAAAGQLYLAAIATKNRVSVNSVSGLGLTWTFVKSQCAGRNQTGVEVWMAQGTPSGNEAVTATLASAPNSAVIAVSRYSGVDASDPIGNMISGNTLGLNGACSGGTDNASYSFNLTTTISGAFAYGAAAMRNKTHTPGAGYTERGEIMAGSSGSAASVAVMDKAVSSPSSVAVNGTFSAAVDWAMVGLEIKPQVAGPLTQDMPVKESATVASATSPTEFRLDQNYPNPFNPTTMISYTLPAASPVRLVIYDMIGRTVAVLVEAMQTAGAYSQVWNGIDSQGRQVASGTYYYRLEAGAYKQTVRMTLIR
jgi:uncharacterized repeat protein (TIGR02543 family)